MPNGWYLREWRKAAGLTLESLADKVGTSAGYLSDLEKGNRRHNSDWMEKLATALNIAPVDLLRRPDDNSPHGQKLPIPETTRLPIRFTVAAGTWAPVDEFREEPLGYGEIYRLPAYEGFPQWLERVAGDSYNMKIPDGSLIHVVDAIAMGYAPRHGDTVVIQRKRGHFVERTLKEVILTPFGTELWPRSYNPKWDQPLSYTNGSNEGDDIEVEIVGKVLGAYQNFSGQT